MREIAAVVETVELGVGATDGPVRALTELGDTDPCAGRPAELRTYPIIAGGGGVALIEDEVDDSSTDDRRAGPVRPGGHLETDLRLGDRPSSPARSVG